MTIYYVYTYITVNKYCSVPNCIVYDEFAYALTLPGGTDIGAGSFGRSDL